MTILVPGSYQVPLVHDVSLSILDIICERQLMISNCNFVISDAWEQLTSFVLIGPCIQLCSVKIVNHVNGYYFEVDIYLDKYWQLSSSWSFVNKKHLKRPAFQNLMKPLYVYYLSKFNDVIWAHLRSFSCGSSLAHNMGIDAIN